MSVELKIPVIGESVTEVTLSSWLKKDGDYVRRVVPSPRPQKILERQAISQLLADGNLAPWSNACGVAANWCISTRSPDDAKLTVTKLAEWRWPTTITLDMVAAALLLDEHPTPLQWLGSGLVLLGFVVHLLGGKMRFLKTQTED